MEKAAESGIGLVGLRNTTHWMRGGTYGKYAAEKGYILICWTNTESVMPPWGGKDPRLGNNPFVIAVPATATAVTGDVCDSKLGSATAVLDMALSQFSYGKMQVLRLAGKRLPFPGGYDKDGHLTDEPGPIGESLRILPMGYWKGSSFAFMLDVLGAILSDGLAAADLDKVGKGNCGGCSQVFIAMDPSKFGGTALCDEIIEQAKNFLKSSSPDENGKPIQWPGEGSAKARQANLEQGIPVDTGVWERIRAL
jgi:3-dehydro-L-gulonate 2-dehydrogenase